MRTVVATVAILLYLGVLSGSWSAGQAQSAPPAPQAGPTPAGPKGPALPVAPAAAASPQRALVNQYCVACHNEKLKSGGLTLTTLNLDAPDQSAEVAEKVIRKLRGGLMPPAGSRRPDGKSVAELVSWLENAVDAKAADSRPGRVALRRLNRRSLRPDVHRA